MADYYATYSNSMDRGYYTQDNVEEPPLSGLSPKAIGISTNPMQDQLQGLKARMFQGASTVELGFSGASKGSMGRGATTPEMYGMDERRDMRELADFNKIKLSTHTTLQMPSLAGFGQHGFEEAVREQAVHEIERAIDFASDTTHGGAIVVHTGEFPRAISEEYGPQFKMYPREPETAAIQLVDKRTGQVQQIKKDMPVVLPEYEIDQEGKRIAKYDFENNKFIVKERKWDYFEKETEAWNKEHPDDKKTVAEIYLKEFLDASEAQARGWSSYHSQEYSKLIKETDDIDYAMKYYEALEKEMDPDRKWMIKKLIHSQFAPELIPPEEKMPTEYLKEIKRNVDQRLKTIRDTSTAYTQEAEKIRLQKENMIPLKDYAIDKTADTLARAAIFAMQKEEKMKREGRLQEPLFIAPENLFPEQYGAHPQELKTIVLKAREDMAKKLAPAYGEERANKLAEEHIRATFDVGHAYTWRKYFEGDPSKSIEENDKTFNKWMMNQVEDLAKAGIIGHVHVSDNFGWEDEHVTPGEGKIPLKEFIEKMKAAGIKDVIVEPAHQDYKAILGGWKTFGSPVYGVARENAWEFIEHSYFGKGAPPYFLYGDAAPRPDEWVLWSGVRME